MRPSPSHLLAQWLSARFFMAVAYSLRVCSSSQCSRHIFSKSPTATNETKPTAHKDLILFNAYNNLCHKEHGLVIWVFSWPSWFSGWESLWYHVQKHFYKSQYSLFIFPRTLEVKTSSIIVCQRRITILKHWDICYITFNYKHLAFIQSDLCYVLGMGDNSHTMICASRQ